MASTAIVKRLKNTGEYHIIGADIFQKNQIATSEDVDEFYTFPPAIRDLDSYIEFTLDFIKKNHIGYYFATIDEEIANLSRNRERFADIGVKLCIPNRLLVETCHYKNRFAAWISSNMPDIAIDSFDGPCDISPEDFPVFIKPIEGRASIGCRRVDTREQLEELERNGADFSGTIIQRYIEGEIITVDMIRNAQTGQATLIQRIETLRNSNGCGIAVEIINDLHLDAICRELMEKLELNGVVNAEFFRIGDEFRIIEVNPRFSAGTEFSCLAGCDTVINEMRIARGEPCDFGQVAYGRHFAKRYETCPTD